MIEFLNIDILSYYVQNAETAPQHSYTIYWIILLGSMLLSWLVSARMKSRFSEYSQIPIPMTGREVAEQMLKDNHITDVKVTSTPGHLTDHYNPADKTVNLSESVYNSNSIAAAAVAAHEVGHAVQHAADGPAMALAEDGQRQCAAKGVFHGFSPPCPAGGADPPPGWSRRASSPGLAP